MSKKTSQDKVNILQKVYFPGKYNPATHFVADLNLLHSTRISGVGGEQALNDANTKVLVGVSDFNGTLTPTDANGLIGALTLGYGKVTMIAANNNPLYSPALISYSEKKSDFPAWLLASELVVKTNQTEVLRMRVREFVTAVESDRVPKVWANELESTFKVIGGSDLQIFLNTPVGASLDADEYEFIRINAYGIKFAERKAR